MKQELNTYASEIVTISDSVISGTKGTGNGFVNYKTPVLNVTNVKVDPECTAYNIFEGSQTDGAAPICQQKRVTIDKLTCDDVNLRHNVLNVYTPADGAAITVKNSTFNLNVNNSNIVRMSNAGDADNVTITFDNIDWSYEDSPESTTADGWKWAGLILFQAYPNSTDASYVGDDSHIKTWKIVIKNCRYNGTKVTASNWGEHCQIGMVYNIGGTKAAADIATVIPVSFE